jgi:peptidoglycan-associated lipoprotein
VFQAFSPYSKKEERKMKKTLVLYPLLLVLLALMLNGCGCFMQAQRGEVAPPPAPEAKAPPPAPPEPVPVQPAPPPPPAPVPMVMLKDVHFDFDKYSIRSGDAEILKENMDWFKANPGQKVRIEGNCDERGTIEYNLGLGQRRADSTKKYLMDLGVDGMMLDTISYGKERPVCNEHNEGCWARNRNAHFEPVK